MGKRKNPERTREKPSTGKKAFSGLSKQEKKNLLDNLENEDELRRKIAVPLVDHGIDTSVNDSWPEILEALNLHLISRFKIFENLYDKKAILTSDTKMNVSASVSASIRLMRTLKHMAQSGELWSGNIGSPLKAFVELGYYWRNRLLRGLENKTSDRAYRYLSRDHLKAAHECFEKIIGIPFETLEELDRKIDRLRILDIK